LKTHRIHTQKFLFIAITVAIIGMPVFAAAKIDKVAVIPFRINSEKDLSYLKDGISSMFESRLSWEGKVQVISREVAAAAAKDVKQPLNESNARSIGSKLKADYILFGNLTVFGNSVSIDAKMVDVSKARETLTFYNQSQGMNEVIPRVNMIADEINQKVFGRKTKVRSLQSSEVDQRDSSSAYAHPETVLRESTRSTGSGSPFIYSGGEGESAGFRKTRNLKIEIRGLSIGDVDGDGTTETIFISPQKLHIYRFDQGGFVKIQEIPGQTQHRYIGVDVADIKKDGVDEIFVSCINDKTRDVQSFVVEWDGKEFKTTAKNQQWYYRILNHPMFGKILVGQKRVASSQGGSYSGSWSPLAQNAFKIEWDDIKKAYVRKDKLKLPKGSNIFGLAIGDMKNERNDLMIGFNKDDNLRIFNHAGKEDWTSEEEYGGSENFLEYDESSVHQDDPMKDRLFLPHRIFIADLNENGKNEVIVVKNHTVTGKLFSRYRRFSGAQVQALTWNGLGLAPLWHTRKVSGYFSDYQLDDVDDDGDPEIIISVVSRREATFEEGKSAVIVYELDTLKREDTATIQESD